MLENNKVEADTRKNRNPTRKGPSAFTASVKRVGTTCSDTPTTSPRSVLVFIFVAVNVDSLAFTLNYQRYNYVYYQFTIAVDNIRFSRNKSYRKIVRCRQIT